MVVAPERPEGTRHRGVREAVRTLFASRNELEAAEERRETVRTGCTAVADLEPRRRAQAGERATPLEAHALFEQAVKYMDANGPERAAEHGAKRRKGQGGAHQGSSVRVAR